MFYRLMNLVDFTSEYLPEGSDLLVKKVTDPIVCDYMVCEVMQGGKYLYTNDVVTFKSGAYADFKFKVSNLNGVIVLEGLEVMVGTTLNFNDLYIGDLIRVTNYYKWVKK